MGVMKWLDKNIEEFLLVVFLVLMTCTMGIQIGMRYIFNNSLVWSEELTRYLFIWSSFLSISYCIKNGISIKIEQLYDVVPKSGKKIIKIFENIILLLFFIYIFKFSVQVVISTYLNNQTSPAMGLPIYLVRMSTVVGFFLCIIRIVQNLFQILKPSNMVK